MEQAKPTIGEYWNGHGGIYAGLISEGGQQFHLVLAPRNEAETSLTWGEYPKTIEGDFSFSNGQHNTQLMLAAQPENAAAKFVSAVTIDGLQDFYLPSQKELMLCYVNLQDHFEQRWHWSSTQYSAHYAWFTYFVGGTQFLDSKDCSYAVRAVRRELLI